MTAQVVARQLAGEVLARLRQERLTGVPPDALPERLVLNHAVSLAPSAAVPVQRCLAGRETWRYCGSSCSCRTGCSTASDNMPPAGGAPATDRGHRLPSELIAD